MAKTPLEIKSLARSHTHSALTVLAAIMNKGDAPESARVSAANSLLDRGWGKPAQAIEHTGNLGVDLSGMDDNELSALIAAIRTAAASASGGVGEAGAGTYDPGGPGKTTH